MKQMPLPSLTMDLPLYNTSSNKARGNCVFLGEFQPIGKMTVTVEPSVLAQIAGADHYILNLESTLCKAEPCHPSFSLLPRFAITLDEFKRMIRPFRIPLTKLIVNIANNHSYDRGPDSIKITTKLLQSIGCQVIGTQADPYCTVGGVRIVGCTTKLNPLSMPHASELVQPDDPIFYESVATLPYVHWGWEYYEEPDPATVALSEKWMSTRCNPSQKIVGIIGHGPHLLQKTVVLGDNHPCVYSLGDTLIRSKRPVSKGNPRALSGILRVQLTEGKLSDFHMIPVLQEHTTKKIVLQDLNTDDSKARFAALYP